MNKACVWRNTHTFMYYVMRIYVCVCVTHSVVYLYFDVHKKENLNASKENTHMEWNEQSKYKIK